jgi:predicted DNA-binding transcriptional regulator YafY
MGQRSAGATLARIYEAFLSKRTWAQADLARRVGVGVPALRRRLLELRDAGMPLDDEEDHPHIYWSVPSKWFPGGVLVPGASVPALIRLLLRLPSGAKRDRMLDEIVRGARAADQLDPSTMQTPSLTAVEDSYQEAIEDAARERLPVRMRYYTASRGAMEDRHVSIHKVQPGPPVRFAAVCHREGLLKWFRLENVQWVHSDPAERYRPADDDDLTAFLAASLDGFHQGDPPRVHRFVVRAPESRWVKLNLPGPMTCEDTGSGVRVSAETSGLLRLARFVVGLGDAARAETPELAAIVRELAAGALGASPKGTAKARGRVSPTSGKRQRSSMAPRGRP